MRSSRKYAASTLLLAGLSVGGGIAANDLWLNPDQAVVARWASNSSGSNGSGGSTGPTTKTGTGDAIQYEFGTVQLKVTQVDGKITAIEEIQATATDGREQAFPYLHDYAIQANGTSFGNISGATYTTDAYKQALDSALANLG